MTPHDQARWVRRALRLATLTLVYNVVEGLVAIAFGVREESVALLGFGVDSFIEVGSALLVIWRFRGEHRLRPSSESGRERLAAQGIGSLFVLLAVGTALGAGYRLWHRQPPDTAVPGLLVALVSLSFMFALWHAKTRVARALDSATVASDAACSRACIQLSAVLLVGSLLYLLIPALWWADSGAALVLSVLIGREGWGMVAAARKPDFCGGCGCCH